MNQTITVSPKTVEEILSRLDQLTKEVRAIKAKLFQGEPPYGSDEWWEWSEKKADEDIKTGRISAALDNKRELQEFLDSLKTP